MSHCGRISEQRPRRREQPRVDVAGGCPEVRPEVSRRVAPMPHAAVPSLELSVNLAVAARQSLAAHLHRAPLTAGHNAPRFAAPRDGREARIDRLLKHCLGLAIALYRTVDCIVSFR